MNGIQNSAAAPAGVQSSVVAAGPMPAEQAAYTLARYSRSPDSIQESIEWVRNHDTGKFLESFYFQYGHGSIADLGHLVLSFERVSELAAIEIVDEQVWDGQQKSTRYQNFGKSGYVIPELPPMYERRYREMADKLLEVYGLVLEEMQTYLKSKHPRPNGMKEDAYERNITARAFDTARYLLFLGIPTNVGQVTSIRTLEKQVRRLGTLPLAELQRIALQMREACINNPGAQYYGSSNGASAPVAPTLAKYMDPGRAQPHERRVISDWLQQHFPNDALWRKQPDLNEKMDLIPNGTDQKTRIVCGLLYPYTRLSFLEIKSQLNTLPDQEAAIDELLGLLFEDYPKFEDLPRAFRDAPYMFDIVMDIGAYRDLHRHRRTIQIRQEFSTAYGYSLPANAYEAGLGDIMRLIIELAHAVVDDMHGHPNAQYLLPFATNCRSLHKMDFEQVRYVSELRSGVKGHQSYREVAWRMYLLIKAADPSLARYIHPTPPTVQDPLVR